MKALKNLMPCPKRTRGIDQWGMAVAGIVAILAGTASTARAQAPAPKKTIIRAGRVLNVRTGELKANQAIVIEGDKIALIAPFSEIKAAAGGTTIELPCDKLPPRMIEQRPP